MSSLMFLATGSLILPTAYEAALPPGSTTEEGVLSLSRGTSIILLTIYLLYLFFQLRTHCDRFEPVGLEDNVEEESEESIGFRASISTVLVVAIAISVCSDNLVGSIDAVVESSGVSKTFYALILIPVIGNTGTCSTL
jgi:Ca2+:H+ antiporter